MNFNLSIFFIINISENKLRGGRDVAPPRRWVSFVFWMEFSFYGYLILRYPYTSRSRPVEASILRADFGLNVLDFQPFINFYKTMYIVKLYVLYLLRYYCTNYLKSFIKIDHKYLLVRKRI